ncbi:LmbE family N-acetylglucosaminyl deacetylase [Salirhabdus euzebyi]|uniref:LmbE family N-acetylglucosaminyl deacetylase n=1 Tax=Salirhabdus euzebyi TaxID=394506 RepID=A0A841Q4L5_9BACI|nr:PIG-L deacetylase family protein [Salirhabdus euzebyi]MBB6453303.1 LmbE family N-acetylglucosaminyl deacetylase [Salirhabdus euzebyi]
MFQVKKLLVLAPHTDDAELGSGGLIARLIEEGMDVYVVSFSAAEQSIPEDVPKDTLRKEFRNSMSILGVQEQNMHVFHYKVRTFSDHRQEILDDLITLRNEINPDLVCLPCSHDVHQDHQVIHNEGKRAFKNSSVLGYELPWNQTNFSSEVFVGLDKRHIDQKWNALKAYRSQIAMNRPYFTDDFIYGLARLRGTQIKKEWAEAYEVVRVIV